MFDFLTFDIFFDNLTIFFDICAIGHMGNGAIMVNTADRDGAPWAMGHMGHNLGHMGNGKHGPKGYHG